MNQKNAAGEHHGSHDKEFGQRAPASFGESNVGLHERQQQSEIPEIDDVRMGVYLCSAVLEQAADGRELTFHGVGISGDNRLSSGKQSFADGAGILVKHKNREDIAEDQPGNNERDPSDNQKTRSAHRGKHRQCNCSCRLLDSRAAWDHAKLHAAPASARSSVAPRNAGITFSANSCWLLIDCQCSRPPKLETIASSPMPPTCCKLSICLMTFSGEPMNPISCS